MNTAPALKSRQRRLKHEDRRQQLIETTILCLAKYGPQGTGVRQVCRELGVAPSLVNYFFDGRNDLLLNAYQLLSQNFLASLKETVEQEHDGPEECIRAIFSFYFANEWFDDTVVGAYIALWALSRTEIDLKAAMSGFHHSQKEALLEPLAKFAKLRQVSGIDIDLMANCLVAFLTGLWLEMSLNPGNIPVQTALQMSWAWMDGNFRPTTA